jgi:DNA-binding PadR family transcriptional regulator
MRHRHHGCGPRGHVEFTLPEALMAMRGGRGWQGNWGPFHFDFGDEGWSGGGRGRGRRSRRMFESGELRLVLLKLIADEPRHGYDLIRAIEEMTGGEYAPSPGVVYPTLTLLQDMGLIEEAPVEGARRPFQVTDEGRAHLEERAEEIDGLFERLNDLKPREGAAGGSPVWRAMRNLGMAIRNRLHHGDVTDETVHELAALIDEFAQRVERLK